MRATISFTIMAIAAAVSAIPITPAAPAAQRLVERMRAEGLDEHEIATRLSLPLSIPDIDPQPFTPSSFPNTFTDMSSSSAPFKLSFSSLFRSKPLESDGDRDASGDIPPGSLESPEMLPRAAVPDSFLDYFRGILHGEDRKRREFGYEGKELEMRRPQGGRWWGNTQPAQEGEGQQEG